MTRSGLALASYGTAQPDARQRDIEPLVRELREAMPDGLFCEAYLSSPVRRLLERKGVAAPGTLGDALSSLLDAGAERICVQPGLIMAGSTMGALLAEASGWDGRFADGIVVGKPLLSSPGDILDVARAIAEAYPAQTGCGLVLVGHGAAEGTNQPYLALRDELRRQGRTDVFLGLLDGEPGIDDVIAGIEGSGFRTATLVPLMLAAGSHVARQLGGDAPTSWKSQLNERGVETGVAARGLGSLREIRPIFQSHARAALRS
ncbi:MAG: sirohydrochlorin cobaltochelatase [Olsenella sp.]|jgi:sirohydrochlorin cobaltochelatase|nr:sirohydrochlorin cobaltochelatase [Olsenella sp.]